MLYSLLYPLTEYHSVFNIFRYITFRAMLASITAFLICVVFGPKCIKWLRKINLIATNKREHAPQLDDLRTDKKNTPTMGGLIIVFAVVFANLLWADLQNNYIILILLLMVAFSMIGFLDDYLKISYANSKGLHMKEKLIGQVIAGLFLGLYLYLDPTYDKTLTVPFLKDVSFHLGISSIFFIMFIIVAASNSLNITDGLDGLAIGCTLFAVGCFAIIAYITGNYYFSDYLNLIFLKGSGELAVFCSSLVGAGVGFLWFNCYPAQVFMGDTGSLAIGGAIGAVAILIKQELLLIIVGGVFVWETISVILQVLSFKLTGKRIFKMAPFHHHLQLKGWPESKIIVRFWIISFILAIAGLATLKIR